MATQAESLKSNPYHTIALLIRPNHLWASGMNDPEVKLGMACLFVFFYSVF